jgi:signal transduction histidine kinase
MRAPRASSLLLAAPDRRLAFWRTALSGLTPQLVAVVVALLLIRMISADAVGVVSAVNNHELGKWLLNVFGGLWRICVMAATMLVVVIGTANLGPQHGPKRVAALAVAVVLSAGVGSLLRALIPWFLGGDADLLMLRYVWPRYAVLGGMMTAVGEFYRLEVASLEAAQRAEIDRVALEREMAGARLQVLQAQVEPHFLFNTLANVRRLYDEDSAAGRTMLEKLMRYLEVALPRMRHDKPTLAHDSELVEAFLHIQRIRMGRRLAFSVDIPPELRGHYAPPMMLLTLVENAIKHGLNPLPEGGLIRVTARSERDRLILTVADTGVGFAPGSGSGVGLANICARLAAQFGDRASLTLENNELGGGTATIVLPLTTTTGVQ